MRARVHIGDTADLVLTVKYLDTAQDISSATTKKIKLKSPSGTVTEHTADFVVDGTDGQIHFVCATDTLDAEGVWHIQGYIEIGALAFHTALIPFEVYTVLTVS